MRGSNPRQPRTKPRKMGTSQLRPLHSVQFVNFVGVSEHVFLLRHVERIECKTAGIDHGLHPAGQLPQPAWLNRAIHPLREYNSPARPSLAARRSCVPPALSSISS